MKSKLFLSLSLLTAVFSQATEVSTLVRDMTGKFVPGEQIIGQSTKFCPDFNIYKKAVEFAKNVETSKLLGKAAVIPAATIGAALGTAYVVDKYQANKEKQTQAQTEKTYFNSAKDFVVNAWNNATAENMKKGLSEGFAVVKNNPGTSTIVAAASAAVLYGAYKLYSGDFSSQAKQTITPKVQEVKAETKRSPRNNYRGQA